MAGRNISGQFFFYCSMLTTLHTDIIYINYSVLTKQYKLQYSTYYELIMHTTQNYETLTETLTTIHLEL